MELHLSSVLLLLSCIIFFPAQRVKKRSAATAEGGGLPPGPKKLPVIGNIHNLVGSLPHRVLRDLAQKYGPLMHLRMGQISVVVVSSPEMAKETLKTHDLNFSNRPDMIGVNIISYGYADVVFAPYGEFWRQLRKICILEVLSAKRVQSFGRVREEETANLVRFVSTTAGSPFNLSQKIFLLSTDVSARSVFGDRCEDQEGFKTALDEALKLMGGFNVADLYPSSKWIRWLSRAEGKFQKFHRKLDKTISRIIEAHREKRMKIREEKKEGIRDDRAVEDLVDVLLRVQKQGDLEFELTDDNIKGVILDIFAAGTETSSTTMVWAMSHLMKNPKVMLKAQEEVRRIVQGKETITENDIAQMNYLKLVIRETLRLSPPLPLLVPRESIDDCKIGGYQIPKKTRVLVNMWAIGRDPKHWENPDEFIPERFLGTSVDFKDHNFDFIPFGSGRRGCPGVLFGLAVIERALASLLYGFDWKLPHRMVARKSSLYVTATPFVPY